MKPDTTTIYLTRDSFCMADDVLAPNANKYDWVEGDTVMFYFILEDYIGCNLPGYLWRGYCGGEMIAEVNLDRTDMSLSREITLEEGWSERLKKYKTVHFLHCEYENRDSLPETIDEDEGYTYAEAKKLPIYNIR